MAANEVVGDELQHTRLPLSAATAPASVHAESVSAGKLELLQNPSRGRQVDRLRNTIAAGAQPTGQFAKQLVEDGLGPAGFLEALQMLRHPMEEPPFLPQRLRVALETLRYHGMRNIGQWRQQRMQQIRDAAARLEPLRANYTARLHPEVAKVIGHLHLPLLEWLLKSIEYEDIAYMRSLMAGRPLLGPAHVSNVFPKAYVPATITLENWARDPYERNRKMIDSVGPSGDEDLDWASWHKTEQEIERGYAEGPFQLEDYDLNLKCFTPRFPKWERKDDGTWAARNISDYKRSGGNSTVEMFEKYSPEDLNSAWALTRALKEAFGKAVKLTGFRADYQMAFRQDPADPTQEHLTLELTWHPGLRQVVVIRVKGQSFGGKSTQLNYVRDPQAMCAIARSWLAMLTSHYSDDVWLIEPTETCDQSYDLWLELNVLVGWRIDLAKSPRPAGVFKLLGAQLHLSAAQPFGICHPDRREALIATCQSHKRSRKISGPEAGTLRGKLGHERSLMWGRFGMAALRPLQERQETSAHTRLNPSIESSLDF